MDCQIRQGLLSTAHVAFEKLRSVVRGHRRVNPHPRTWTTVLVQLHERGTDVITPPYDDYLLPFFDTSFRPPSPKSSCWQTLDIVWHVRGQLYPILSQEDELIIRLHHQVHLGHQRGDLPGFLMPTATTPGRPRSTCPKVKPPVRWTG